MGNNRSNHLKTIQELKKDKNSNTFPFNNNKIITISEDYCLSHSEITELYYIFVQLDHDSTGYIEKESFYLLLREKKSSVVSFYADYLFEIIPKKFKDKIDFFEWIMGIIDFGLANEDMLLRFVFRLIDNNNDQKISIKNMYRVLASKKHGKCCFPINSCFLLEKLELKKELIDFNEFKELQEKLFFLIYPAFKLNERIQDRVLGPEFWLRQVN